MQQTEHDTQPLTPDQVPVVEDVEDRTQQARDAWDTLTQHPLIQALREANKPPPHVHGPFTFLINPNHNALRGCQSCGQTWVGVMAGESEADLSWHPVQETEEEQE